MRAFSGLRVIRAVLVIARRIVLPKHVMIGTVRVWGYGAGFSMPHRAGEPSQLCPRLYVLLR